MNEPVTIQTQTREDLLMEIVQDFSSRLRNGQRQSIDAYANQHPDLAEMIRDTLAAVETMIAMDPADVQPASDEVCAGDEFKPHVLGDFRIIREIGRGGMGVVYEGEQISLGRRVALKVLPYAAMLDSRRLQRFKNEAHSAATLHHNNIVPVFAIGSERSVHFYAMQLIEGQTLAQIIQDLQRLEQGEQPSRSGVTSSDSLAEELTSGDLPQLEIGSQVAESTLAKAELSTKASKTATPYYRSVAKLIEQACEALHYAHQHGVIHRDIKPSNLMVDADGRMWVTDFGLAQMECDAQITITGDIVGTLRYMSPEQALAKRVTIDHRTDIYSLGATLYELLTLQAVISGDDRQQVMRNIAFDEPRRPRKVRPSVPADLETIALKALEKSPDSRYQSAQEMADDLSRYLKHEPIRAQRPSLAQLASKWAVRHAGAVCALAAVFLIITIVTASASVLIWQAKNTAEIEAANAKTAKAASDASLIRAETAFDLLQGMLRSPDPTRDGRTITVVEVLDKGLETIDSVFAEDPLAAADFYQSIGNTYLTLQLPKKAQIVFQKAHDLFYDQPGSHSRASIENENLLGVSYFRMNDFEKAFEIFEQLLPIAEETLGTNDATTINIYINLATNYSANHEPANAIPMLKRVLKETPTNVAGLNNLAQAYVKLGDLDAAIETMEILLEQTDALLVVRNFAVMLMSRGLKTKDPSWFQKAIKLMEPGLPLMRTQYGLHTNAGHDFARTLATIYRRADRLDESVGLFRELSETHRNYGDSNAWLLANSLRHLGKSLIEQEEFEKASDSLRESLDLHDQRADKLDPDGIGKYYAMFWLGQALVGLNQNQEAEKFLTDGGSGLVARLRPTVVERTKRTTDAVMYIAEFFESQGRPKEAEQWRTTLNRIRAQIDEAVHPN